MNKTHYDVAIVGGGHNGLSAACYLAQAGKSVVVIESLDKVGGMATSGYVIPGAPEHLVHTCALDQMWDAHVADVRQQLTECIVNGGEAACVYRNLRPATATLGTGVEIYAFHAGTLTVRIFH